MKKNAFWDGKKRSGRVAVLPYVFLTWLQLCWVASSYLPCLGLSFLFEIRVLVLYWMSVWFFLVHFRAKLYDTSLLTKVPF